MTQVRRSFRTPSYLKLLFAGVPVNIANTGGKITVVTKASQCCTGLECSTSLQWFRMVSATVNCISKELSRLAQSADEHKDFCAVEASSRMEKEKSKTDQNRSNRFDAEEVENRNSENVECHKMWRTKITIFQKANQLHLHSPGFPTQPLPGQTSQTGQTQTKSLGGLSGSSEAVDPKIEHVWRARGHACIANDNAS